ECRTEMRSDAQVPGDAMALGIQISPTAAFVDSAFRNAAMKGKLPARSQLQLLEREINNERLRLWVFRKPRGPHLKILRRCAGPRRGGLLHKQISEPPGPPPVSQPAAHEPHLIAPAHLQM